MIVRLNTDLIQEQKLLSSHSLEELGCSSDGCMDSVTHIALVEIKLVDGRKLIITRPYCATCIMATQSVAKA